MSDPILQKTHPLLLCKEAIDDAITATIKAGAHEMCGLFVPDNRSKDTPSYHFIACTNHAQDSTSAFEMSDEAFAPYRGRDDVIIVHSHPNGPSYPSQADLALAKALGIVVGLIAPFESDETQPNRLQWGTSHDFELILFGRPNLVSLTERIYRHGVTDCYGFVRDYLAAHHDVLLPDMPRSWAWWDEGQNLYRDYFESYGFVMVDEAQDLQQGDVFVARLRAPVDNHGGVYCGHGLIRHHLAGRYPVDRGRLVTCEPVSRIQPFISFWLRHETLMP